MEQVAATIREWVNLGWRVAFGRVIDVQGFGGSSQEELFAVNELGDTAGGLLSGTLDDLVLAAARAVLAGPAQDGMQLVVGDVHGDVVVQAGLACGGTASVLVQTADGVAPQFWKALAEQMPVALATVVEGPGAGPRALTIGPDDRVWGSLGDPASDLAVTSTARALLSDGTAAIRRVESELGTVLIEALIPSPRLVVVGSGALADALVFQASILGWPGRIAADIEGAGAALAWAGQSGAVVVLSHVPSLDAPALAAAIEHGAFYLGALGSRRTQAARTNRLQGLGVADADIERIRGPVGLDLGGQTPALIALAVCAEILAVRTGRDAAPLRHRHGPIRPQTIGRQLRR
jgi:xanthine dehydrogenase accessory factor